MTAHYARYITYIALKACRGVIRLSRNGSKHATFTQGLFFGQ